MTGWKKHRQDELWTRQLFALLSGSKRLGHVWTGAGGMRGGVWGGLWVALEVTRLNGLFAATLSDSKAHGLPSSSSLKTVFPLEGQGAVGQSLSYKGMAFTNQPPSVFSSAAAWHVKQQLLRRLVYIGFTSVAAFLLFFLFVVICSAHCFSSSYVLIQLNTLLYICKVTLTLILHWLLSLNSHSEIESHADVLQLRLFAHRGW